MESHTDLARLQESLPLDLQIDERQQASEWVRLSARLGLNAATPSPLPRRTTLGRIGQRQSPWTRIALPVALGATALVLGVLAWPRMMDRTGHNTRTIEYATHRGERANVTLPDGSRIVLGPDTRLTLGAQFGRDTRTVQLDGQAYFTVDHAKGAPFVVQTARTITRVLGTAFAVRAYAADTVAQIAVAEGKVALNAPSAEQEPVVLLPGDVGSVSAHRAPRVVHDATLADVFGWMHGQLVFNDVPLSDMIVELERTYDLDVRLTDSTLGSRRVTAVFTNQSLTDMIIALSGAIDATYTLRGRVVTLAPRSGLPVAR